MRRRQKDVKKINRGGVILMVFSLLTTVLMAGCSGTQSAAPSKQDKNGNVVDVIKLTTPKPTTSSSVYIADKLGFFKEEGLSPEFVGEIPNAQLPAAVASGQINAGAGHVNQPIAAIAAGAKIKVVVAASETSQKQPHMVFAVKEDSPIRSAQDLIGKKVALSAYGSCTEYTPYEYLRKNGGIADPKGKFQFVVIPEANMEQALLNGEVDVIGLHKSPEYVAGYGGLRVLFSDYDVWGGAGGATPFYFSTKFMEERPEAVKKFVRAISKANNWINANQDKANDIMAQGFNVSKEKVSRYYFAENGIIKDESVQIWIDILRYYKDIRPSLTSAEAVYTNEFNPHFQGK